MNYFLIAIAAIVFSVYSAYADTIPGTHLEKKQFELNVTDKPGPTLSYNQLKDDINSLNRYIGSYPPRFQNEAQRQSIYRKWLALVSEAEAYKKIYPDTEQAFYILSELYRQGHNMDVKGSAEKAFELLDLCLTANKNSVTCNFSASYFFLSIGPKYLDKAEQSLSFLRKHFSPEINSEVEAGYVFLYLYRQDVPQAKNQIDFFIEKFPDSSRTKAFMNIKKHMGNTIEWKEK